MIFWYKTKLPWHICYSCYIFSIFKKIGSAFINPDWRPCPPWMTNHCRVHPIVVTITQHSATPHRDQRRKNYFLNGNQRKCASPAPADPILFYQPGFDNGSLSFCLRAAPNQPTNHPLVAHTPPESDRALIFNDTCFRREREEWCGRRLTLVAGLVWHCNIIIGVMDCQIESERERVRVGERANGAAIYGDGRAERWGHSGLLICRLRRRRRQNKREGTGKIIQRIIRRTLNFDLIHESCNSKSN